jgi:hypothetical protein
VGKLIEDRSLAGKGPKNFIFGKAGLLARLAHDLGIIYQLVPGPV